MDAINLANQHGSEGELSKKMLELAERYSQMSTGLRLVPFDFHKECGASRYDRCGPLQHGGEMLMALMVSRDPNSNKM